jgi:hypothetical protein
MNAGRDNPTEVTVPLVGFVQVGAPAPPEVKTCPEVPTPDIDVVPAPDWYKIVPRLPPAIFVAVVAVVALPVKGPANPVAVKIPVLGTKLNFVEDTVCGRFPVLAVTHVG